MHATDVNRAHWDALARVHGALETGYYDAAALVAGRDSLGSVESAAVGDVTGLDVMPLQCPVGFDPISLARRGAPVTGVAFSPASRAGAEALAERCGVDLKLVQADSTALPESLHGRFDVVYATIGVLCWIEDAGAWMRNVHAVLRPGGRLVLVELHPLYLMVDSVEPLELGFPYAFDGPRAFEENGSYADRDADVGATATVEFAHSVGEVVTAALSAGLRIDALREHFEHEREHRGLLAADADGRYRL